MLSKEIQLEVNKGAMPADGRILYPGEGYHTGTAAYFIRIGGCDVGCHWCDVKESWNAELHPPTGIELIVSNASKYSETVVVTESL
jgi:organic radical activating enzyme